MVYIYDYMFIPPIYGDLGVGFLLFYQHELISATRIFVKWPFWGGKIPDGRGKSLLLSIKARRGKMVWSETCWYTKNPRLGIGYAIWYMAMDQYL